MVLVRDYGAARGQRMSLYEIYGKWFHLQYSDYFSKVVKAPSARTALYSFAKCFSGVSRASEIQWQTSPPRVVGVGLQEHEPAFMVADDQMYQIRRIIQVKLATIECQTCNGAGKTEGHIPVEPQVVQ